MIQTWRITPTQNFNLEMQASSLDEVTRQLPDPEGYYSTFRTFDAGTRVLGITAHLQRLYGPVSTPEVDESFLRRQLFTLLETYRPGEARVRAVMTKQGQVYLLLEPLKLLPPEVYENGVRVETTELQRQYPRLKSTSFIGQSNSERKHIAREGIFEALLVKDGKILEGMTSNFFYVLRVPEEHRDYPGTARQGMCSERNEPEANAVEALSRKREVTLYTARDKILLGITRETVIHLGRELGLDIKYQPLKRNQLEIIDEAFITSSSRGIVPVIQIDHVTIGQGSPGSITKQLIAAYEKDVLQRAEKI